MAHSIKVDVYVLHVPPAGFPISLGSIFERGVYLGSSQWSGCSYELLPSSRRLDNAGRTHLDPLSRLQRDKALRFDLLDFLLPVSDCQAPSWAICIQESFQSPHLHLKP